jgi:hypothetical protein
MLPDRSEARQKSLRAFGITKTTQAALAFTCRLLAVFSAVVNPGTGFDEDVLDVDQFWDLGLCRRIAAQLVGHDLARCLGTSGKNALEKPLGCRLVPAFLQQDIELYAALIDCSSQQIGLAAKCHEHFVEVPGRAWLATRSLDAMREPRAELVGPTPDRFVADDHPAFKEQLFNVAIDTQSHINTSVQRNR